MKMLQIFGGMILGSIITLLLLGGRTAADQVVAHIQAWYLTPVSSLGTPTTLLLLGMVSLALGVLWLWPTKPALNSKHLSRLKKAHFLAH